MRGWWLAQELDQQLHDAKKAGPIDEELEVDTHPLWNFWGRDVAVQVAPRVPFYCRCIDPQFRLLIPGQRAHVLTTLEMWTLKVQRAHGAV